MNSSVNESVEVLGPMLSINRNGQLVLDLSCLPKMRHILQNSAESPVESSRAMILVQSISNVR